MNEFVPQFMTLAYHHGREIEYLKHVQTEAKKNARNREQKLAAQSVLDMAENVLK